MKNLLPKLLFYYSAITSFFIAVSITLTTQSIAPLIFGVLFLPVAAYFVSELFKQMRSSGSDITFSPKKGEVAAMFIVFLILVGLGVRNIYAGTGANQVAQQATPSATSSPLIFKTAASPTPLSKLQVTITDGSASINIREKPTIYSNKIGVAKDGDTFDYTQKVGGWYEIKMIGGTLGYLSPNYVKEVTQ